MKSIFVSFGLALSLAFPAQAQMVQQSGTIKPGHAARWVTNHVVQDAGPAGGGPPGTGLTDLNVTNKGQPFCINSAPITTPYYQSCFGVDDSGNGLMSFNAQAGATPTGLNFEVNHNVYPFPGNGQGNIMGPNTSAVGHFPLWNNTGGTLLAQISPAAGNFVPTQWYNGTMASAPMGTVVGSAGVPDTTVNSVIQIQKVGSQSADFSANPALYASLISTSGADSSHGTGIMGAAQDSIGHTGSGGLGASTFYEGVRGQCDLKAPAVNGFCEGTVGEAEAQFGATYTALVGMEASVNNYTGVDAPEAFDDLTLNVGFLASCDDHPGFSTHTAKCGQAFQVNENNGVKYQYGFFVPPGNSVAITAFYNAASLGVGLDLANGGYSTAAIRLPNGNSGGIITGYDHTGQAGGINLQMMGVNQFDQLVIGGDTRYGAVVIGTTGVPLFLNNPAITLNNNVPIQSYNFAHSAQLELLMLNASDQLVLAPMDTLVSVEVANISGTTPTNLNSAAIKLKNVATSTGGKCIGINTTTHQLYVSGVDC